jgi:HD superfamily phosphodiesterase
MPVMNDEQRRSHAMQQLRAARELYSDTGDRAYLSVIDAHLHTIAEVDARRRIAEARRAALLELARQEALKETLDETFSAEAVITAPGDGADQAPQDAEAEPERDERLERWREELMKWTER